MNANDFKLIRAVLALVWIVTGLLSMGIYPKEESLKLLAQVGLHGDFASVALYGSATLDLLLGILTVFMPSQMLWRVQSTLILTYSIMVAYWLPAFWLHPFGPLLKNFPILVLLWLLHQREEITQ